jgi:hypothetical protein
MRTKAEQIRKWKADQDAVNRVTLEEARSRTPYDRLLSHQRFLSRLAAMDRLPERNPADKFYVRWEHVRERWLERHPAA